ncbi:MAG TPA: cupin domain-containing protein [Bryobacteraceae bacterium]|nr:cupin domain-containing protein [Bryobacteraceae bacterium]
MPRVSRRNILAAGAAGGMLTAAIQSKAQQAAIRGPQNPDLTRSNPDSFSPPVTDHGDTPAFKYSFSVAHNRVQEGGWARQVTVRDFPLSTSMAGVNMRLAAGSIRELHWHLPAEWAYMLYGQARITAIDLNGASFVRDVGVGDLWYFPSGIPHSIQGLGPDGCEFLLVFDDGGFSEFDTFQITDWMAHTPRPALAKNFGLAESAFADIPKHELYIFPGQVPGPIANDKRAAEHDEPVAAREFAFALNLQEPTKRTRGGEVHIVDSGTFHASTTIAAARVTVRPGGMRELHWHPNADEWQYYVAGEGRMTVFAASSRARTMDFRAGDVGYVKQSMGHYVENTGNTDLVFLEMFRTAQYQELSLANWMAHTPPELVQAHLHLAPGALDSIPHAKQVIVPM